MSLTRRHVIRGLAAIPPLLAFPLRVARAQIGRFIGAVVTKWDANGRDMTLVERFEFIDPEGQRWPVPAGAVVDGASIPRVFWSVIGGPFEGLYRNASVIHDYYCGVQVRNYEAVHRVFYDAMMASGVESTKAWLMYEAVERFGPRWPDTEPGVPCSENGEDRSGRPCEGNFSKSTPVQPVVNKQELESFIAEVKDKADPQDIAKLQEAAKSLD